MDDYKEKQEEKKDEYGGRIGAVGFGLTREQQEAIADLWEWQERSLKSRIIIGGPVEGVERLDLDYDLMVI
ncbi:hypothetical protein FJZ19_00560 [Candidatus Pacearchaeota archaeon]|nr:hypothetical protein [Candidatus Pacearchaeota archaeon]